MVRTQRIVNLLILLIVCIVLIQMTSLFQGSSETETDTKLTGRSSKTFFLGEHSETETGFFSDDFPNVTYLEERVKRYLAVRNTPSSQKYPWNFNLEDNRHSNCDKTYGNISSANEQSVSIVIGTGDSSLSQILSSVLFILSNTRRYLVRNIFVVADTRLREPDFDTLEDLLIPVPFFRTFRLPNITADLVARAFAHSFTSTEFVVMMDARVIVTSGWLEPLLHGIQMNYKHVLVPNLILNENEAKIDSEKNRFRQREIDWDLNLRWGTGPQYLSHIIGPFAQPAIYENLFLVSAKYFKEIGGFDHLRDGSGAEAVLWSIKTWICQGKILRSTCSNVFEIENPHGKKILQAPSKVLKYKDYIAKTLLGREQAYYSCLESVRLRSSNSRNIGIIYMSRANQIYRNSLRCDTFKSFLKTAQPELKVPPKKTEFYGRVKMSRTDVYLYVDKNSQIGLVSSASHVPISNDFRYDSHNFMYGLRCIDIWNNTNLHLTACTNINSSKTWLYTNNMFVRKSNQNICITIVPDISQKTLGTLALLPCSQHKNLNKFEFSLRYRKDCV